MQFHESLYETNKVKHFKITILKGGRPLKKIAITGGIGSGKSLAGKIIAGQGYDVFSCDEIYAQITKSEEYIRQIEKAFPSVIVNGAIDRKKLSEIVFLDKEKRELLNAIAHPIIMGRLDEKMRKSKGVFIFAEVPLLFENNYQHLFDYVIVIFRDMEERIQSIMKRSLLSKEDCKKRMKAQFNYEVAYQKGDFSQNCFIVKNDGTKQDFEEKIYKIIDIVKHAP